MIEQLLPDGVRGAVIVGDSFEPDVDPGEQELLGDVSARRRDDFLRGRTCARLAMAELGVSGPVLLDERGSPLWPKGVVGSITHCRGFAAAAVAAASDIASVGIDAESHRRLSAGVARRVCRPVELAWAKDAPDSATISWPTVFFSCRESLYKAWFPLAREWLGFQEVEVALELDDGTEAFAPATARMEAVGAATVGAATVGAATVGAATVGAATVGATTVGAAGARAETVGVQPVRAGALVAGAFRAELVPGRVAPPGVPTQYGGRFLVTELHVVTAVVVRQ